MKINPDESVMNYNNFVSSQSVDAPKWVPEALGAPKHCLVRHAQCFFIFGALPLSEFSAFAHLMPKKAVLDPYLAQLAGANFAGGMPDYIAKIVDVLKPLALQRTKTLYTGFGLSDEAIRWLAVGQRGSSSEAMFVRLVNGGRDVIEANDTRHPHDTADVARCRLLLEELPEALENLQLMEKASPTWTALIAKWGDICASMDNESPNWRNREGTAPVTNTMIDEIVNAKPAAPRPR
jgi:hypothetical protein